MNNVKFATAIHILSLLAYSKGERLSSEYIAGSINLNPALVRKEISYLRKMGFVASKEGNGGGSYLARPAEKILLSEIYQAVKSSQLLGKYNNPNPACTIGRQINGHLDHLYAEAERSMLRDLEKQTLQDFVSRF
ncbi:Rrf2 family transcriptional regulator [Pedobacter sp. AW31-3R]|uniref:Rrf2 family transcriptional regulator n=1 Tax=Pedobacter sp. AW31-3R TaxID=3445781 RepID=UPI003F9EF7DF